MAGDKTGPAPDLAKRAAFLEALAATCNITKAAELAGVSRALVYAWRAADPKFAQAWEEALQLGIDALEDEATRRAVEGWDEPVFQKGALVGTVRKYSDTLLTFLLQGRRPERFKARVSAEHSGPGGGPIQVEETRAKLAERLARLAAAGAAGGVPGGGDGGGAGGA